MFDSIHQFEPLLPRADLQEPLLAKAHELARAATRLGGLTCADEIRARLRAMNSYYTNRIEGQHTLPHEIDQALRKDFSTNKDLAMRQRLALAHINAEIAIEKRYVGATGATTLYGVDALTDIHATLFSAVPKAARLGPTGEVIVPGQLRVRDVVVGQHIAPSHTSLTNFLQRWGDVYGTVRRGEMALLALAASHQRLGWIHPFIDGNGRVMRLHTHALLGALGYTNGLWSPLRGFARSTEQYYALLAAADLPRQSDLDGRGNLTEKGLVAWINYVLDICLDQVQLMAKLLDVTTMERRIAACLAYEERTLKSGVRETALRPLHYLFVTGGELTRGEFKTMMGLGDRTAVTALTALLKRGLLSSDTPQGNVRFGVPLPALRFYFPALWPEAEADSDERAQG